MVVLACLCRYAAAQDSGQSMASEENAFKPGSPWFTLALDSDPTTSRPYDQEARRMAGLSLCKPSIAGHGL